MAKKKKGEDGAEGGEDTPKKERKGGLLPALILAVAVLAGGAMAGGVIGGGAADAEAAPTPTPTETEPPELGLITQLESLTLNLADGHFLKLGVALEWGPEVAEEPQTAPVYDMVISQFAAATRADLTETSAREGHKERLLETLTTVYGEDIVRIYFTEFVMQ